MLGLAACRPPLYGEDCPRTNLRRDVRVGAWNVRSLRQDDRLPLLSRELGRLRVNVAALLEVRRPSSGAVNVSGYTYYWPGRSEGHHLQGVAMSISNRLQPSVVEVTPANERIMVVRLKLAFSFTPAIVVYAPTDVCKLDVKEVIYAKLASVSVSCPWRDIRNVLGDFNAACGCNRAGYEMCYQRSDPHRWTWYSDVGNAAKEIDHILVSTRWKILQKCRVYRSGEFCGKDHRLVVAILRVHFRTSQRSSDHPRVFHLDSLREGEYSRGFAEAISGRLTVLDKLTDPTLEATDACREGCLTGNRDLHRSQARRTRPLLRRDKEQFLRSLAEVESHFLVNDLRPAYQAIRKVNSKPSSQVIAVPSVSGQIVSDPVAVRERWAEYFEQLYHQQLTCMWVVSRFRCRTHPSVRIYPP
ncbi:craniofacial development protein 2-like [Penaeus vannamei]|uniref:craniofacial development protein 2-like n=1 Tax=Penaeus vannamei TaxID=6689 RepID=UPI00387F44D3